MAGLGFRRPQFSEDSAWLPTWLQQHQVEACIEQETQTPSEEAIKDLALLQRNINEEKDMELLSKEKGGFNRCHLYLSGEDNSPSSFVPSPGNVLHFNLHLSLESDSYYTQAQLLYVSRAHFESDKVLSVQRVETSAGPLEKTCQSQKVDHNAGGENLLPQNLTPRGVKNVGQQSTPSCKIGGRQHEEKFNVKYLKGADINDAIELSIAASEALVIHELVNSESASEALPMVDVLEIALQVKHARLERLEDAVQCPPEEIDRIDFLSELDDLTMADAFEDVGLSFGPDNQHGCGSEVSRVKDTPVSENRYGCYSGFRRVELRAQQIDFDNSFTQKQSENVPDMDIHLAKDLHEESLSCERGKKLSDDLALSLNSSSWVCLPDPMFHQSVQEHSNVLAMSQAVGFAKVDITSFQPQANVNSSHAWISENAEVENNITYLVSERFQSRWLGGWTGKEVDASAQMKKNDERNNPKFFIGETSFLSESADVAPDENSFVQKHGTMSKQVSQISIPFEGLCDTANEGILLSQDVVRSSSLSLIDPLCSVVPCSISLENDCSIDQNQNDRKVDARKCFSLISEHGVENLQKNSDLNVESVYVDGQTKLMITGEGSGATVRRQLVSLKSYSMLSPNHDAIMEREKLCHPSGHTRELCAWGQNAGCTRSSGRRVSEGFMPFRTVSDCAVAIENEENDETTCIGNLITEIRIQKRNDETAKDVAELQIQPHTESRSPLILNHRIRRRLQASKHLVDDSPGDKTPEHAMDAKSVVKHEQNKNFRWKESECNNPHHTQVPVRKRVQFSGLDIQLQQQKDHQELQSFHENCSTSGASKRSKYSKTWSGSRTQDMKRCFTTRYVKNGKIFMFQGIEFLLTGFSTCKEKEMEGLIRKYGGVVLPDIPSPHLRGKRSPRSNIQQLPVILCSKKLQTTKFLYGCAVNAFILKDKWLTDSITAGSVAPPEKYMIISNQAYQKCTRIGKPVPCNNNKYIFEKVGIMLHGKHSFYTKLAIIFRHGGGRVFKTLQWLVHDLDIGKISVGAIVSEDESRASRHLRHCASERKIPMMPSRWIIKSLHSGKLLPFTEQTRPSRLPTITAPKVPISMECSEEI